MAQKILQHQPKGSRTQGTATSMADAIMIFRGLRLYDRHCTYKTEVYSDKSFVIESTYLSCVGYNRRGHECLTTPVASLLPTDICFNLSSPT
jgi:hypothetical protein